MIDSNRAKVGTGLIPVEMLKVKFTQLFIDNKFVDSKSGKTFDCENPATEEKIADIASADEDDVNLAVKTAKRAFEIGSEWRTMDASVRGELINRLADLIERDREYIATLETMDNGKPFGDSFNVDLTLAIKCFRYYAGWCDKITGQSIPVDGPFMCFTRHEPVGIVGAITPWNFPFLMATWKLAPALCCGNCVILKPAEQTPLTSLYLGALIREAGFPPGVVSVLPGLGPAAGAAISSHMEIDKVAFTGSTLVGKKILQAAGMSNCKNVTLELGGKSPMIVFDDANVDDAVEAAHHAIFFNQGECCAAGSRTYVQDAVADEFMRKAVTRAKSRITGDPMQQGVENGAQVSKLQFDKILGMIEEGVKQGATLHCGGKRWGNKGYFIEPTVISIDGNDENICAKEEIFGPVMTVLRFRTVEEVVRRANNSPYGLASGVFTNDLDIAMKLSMQLRAGSVWVNAYDLFFAQAPFGGYKQSGSGRELGQYGLQQYSEVKTIAIKVSSKNS